MEHYVNPAMDQCIAECLNCYRICRQAAMNHCLRAGGQHVEPPHLRLMANCAEICRATADFMLTNSSMYASICGVCAEVCDACGDDCERLGDMEECVQACRSCARSCREMTATGLQGASASEAAGRAIM